jgi:hypothetical protein
VTLEEVLHLKTGVNYLENGNMLVSGEFVDKPEFEKFNRVEIPEEEAYAANCIWVNDTVIVPMGYPAVEKAVRGLGYKVLLVDTSEFRKLDGEVILEKIYAEMDGGIEGEVDTCWVHYAGVNPAEFILKYKGQMKTLHLKDFVCKTLGGGPVYALIDDSGKAEGGSKEDTGFRFKPVGQGIQDFPAILAAAEEVGIDYVIVEQDDSYDQCPMDAARQSREYLKTLGL